MTAADGDTRECAACHCAVATGPFCGVCGADQRRTVTQRRKLLRPNTFVAAHRQPVYLPLITSTLCPHLSSSERLVFRHGLFLALAVLIGVAMLKQLPVLVVMTCFGIPLLFVLYLWRSGIFRDIPASAMILTSVFGIALSVTWSSWTGARVASAYGIPLSAGFQVLNVVDIGLVVAAVDAVLMLMPAVVVRILRLTPVESLDGFVIGALGALAYMAAGTVTWLASQFVAGLLDNYDPWRLLSRGLLYGLIEPLIAAAAGGTMGLLLWFRPNRKYGKQNRIRLALAICTVLVALFYLAVYTIDVGNNARSLETTINLVITVAALQTLRLAMQIAVLHEEPDPFSGRDVRCVHCTSTVPDTPFCPRCGVAARASSRSHRRLRHPGATP